MDKIRRVDGDLHFFDLFALDEIQRLQDSFALATGVASLITAPDGTPLTQPSNFRPLCRDIIRTTEIGCRNCKISDATLGAYHPDGPTIRRCLSAGLWDAGVSIAVGGRHVANWLIGQVRSGETDMAAVLAYADGIGADRAAFADALVQIPYMSLEQFTQAANTLFLLANQMAEQAFRKLSQVRVAEELRLTSQRLRASEERFAAIFQSLNESIFLHEWPSGRMIDVNHSACAAFGYEREELLRLSVSDLSAGEAPYDLDSAQDFLRKAHDSTPQTFEWKARAKDGRLFWMEICIRGVRLEDDDLLVVSGRNIEERKQAEESLRRERRFTDAVLDSVPGLLYLYDAGGRLVRWNKRHVEVTGYSDAELAGMHLDDWYIGDPETLQRIHAAIQRVRACGAAQEEGCLRTKAGIRVPFYFTAVGLELDGREYFTGIGIDMTERKRAEEALRQSEEKFSKLFRLSPDAVLLVALDSGVLLDANDAFMALSGHELDHVRGRMPSDLDLFVDPQTRDVLHDQLDRDGSVNNFEFRLRTKDGRVLPCVLSAQVISLGTERVVMAVARDMAEFRKMQELMIQAEKMISVGSITAGVAHEINNPLGIIVQAAQLLEQRMDPSFPGNMAVARRLGLDPDLFGVYLRERKVETYVRDIRSAAQRAARIIRHMLCFSRGGGVRRTARDVHELIERAVELAGRDYELRASHDFRSVRIIREFAKHLPDIVCVETDIEQAFLNVLRNAAQAMGLPASPPADPTVRIRTRLDGDFVRVEIEDNGPGMSPEVARRIFEPFFTTKPPGQGTGLGLSVAYFVVTQRHGGRMDVWSEPGVGTRFTIDLPLDFSDSAPCGSE